MAHAERSENITDTFINVETKIVNSSMLYGGYYRCLTGWAETATEEQNSVVIVGTVIYIFNYNRTSTYLER